MKLLASLGTTLLIALATGSAWAENDQTTGPGEVEPFFTRGYVAADPTLVDITPMDEALAGNISSRIVYVNPCQPDGCYVQGGGESSQDFSANGNTYVGRSSIISGSRHLDAFAYSDTVWQEVMRCVRETMAPFNITVTDVNPGNVPHWEVLTAGTPQEVGMQQGVGGVSPVSCSGGRFGLINNSVTYAFANVYGPDYVDICWTVAQEVAHSWGLDHEMLSTDPMTYMQGNGQEKRFRNQNAACGEFQNRTCYSNICGGNSGITQQNSYQMIQDLFGQAAPTPPVVTINSPTNGASVEPGSAVQVSVEDDNGVASVALSVDGTQTQSITTMPYIFNLPGTLAEGTHRVTVTATDGQGTQGSASIDVVVGPPCETPGDCADQGENLTCVGGRCVPGEGTPGGLGTPCGGPTDCYSGQCASGNGESYCVEFCTVGGSDCPGGFDCLDAGGQGVCWPGEGDGGGCSTEGGTPTLPIALGVALAAILARRRGRA